MSRRISYKIMVNAEQAGPIHFHWEDAKFVAEGICKEFPEAKVAILNSNGRYFAISANYGSLSA